MLVKANMKRAYFSALAILGSHDDAMEVSQLAFIRAYKNFDKYDRERNFFTWYYKILRNLCLNRIRDNKRKNEIPLLECTDIISDVNNAEETIEQNELKQQVERALFSLKSEDREILIMKEFDKLSYNEIAELLEVPVGSVMSRLFYARKKLAAKLEKELV